MYVFVKVYVNLFVSNRQVNMVKSGICICKKVKKMVVDGVVYIYVFFNNIIVIIFDCQGNVLFWVIFGGFGFCGLCKSIFFVVQVVVERVGNVVVEYGFKNLDVEVKGSGFGCEFVVCVLNVCGYKIINIIDVMLIFYNGCCLFKKCCV